LEARELKTVSQSLIIHPSIHSVVGAAGSLFWPNEEDEGEEEDEEVEKNNKSSAKCLLL